MIAQAVDQINPYEFVKSVAKDFMLRPVVSNFLYGIGFVAVSINETSRPTASDLDSYVSFFFSPPSLAFRSTRRTAQQADTLVGSMAALHAT